MIEHISAEQLHQMISGENPLILLDIREPQELMIARFPDARVTHIPLSIIAQEGISTIPETFLNDDKQLVIFCHLGIRSFQLCNWLSQFTTKQLFNLQGGINEYTAMYAPHIPQY